MKLKKIFRTFLFIIFMEFILYFYIFKNISFLSAIIIMLNALKWSVLVNIITNLFNFKVNKWLFRIIIILVWFIYLINFFNYSFYGNLVSFYSVTKGAQVLEFYSQILDVLYNNIHYILVFLLAFISLATKFNHKENKKVIIPNIIVLILVQVLFIGMLQFNKKEIYSPYNLYYNKHHPIMNFKHFGLITTNSLDIFRYFSKFQEKVKIDVMPDIELNDIKYHTLDIDLDKDYKNDNINLINKYVKNRKPTSHNDYTGMFEGKNLIYLTAEAFHPLAVDKDITPTLYKLVNSSFVFNDFYVPLYYTSTSDGEYMGLTGLLPKENVWSMSKGQNNYYPFSYGHLFKDKDYSTYAYHNGNYKYYDRHKTFPNLGYKYKACGNGLEKRINCNLWPQSDLEMIEHTYNDFINDDQFMVYYMTISGHLEYNFYGNLMANKNKDKVKDLDYSDKIKAYFATHIELDNALKLLLDKLEEHDKLDDTVIVMTSDHYPYGLDAEDINEKFKIENEFFDIHKNNLVIYNSELENKIEVDTLSSNLDVLPTVLNLFNMEFDSRLLIGEDILSKKSELVIFNDRSFITDKVKYNMTDNKITKLKEFDDDYIDKMNNTILNKFNISKLILEEDYYKYILGDKND